MFIILQSLQNIDSVPRHNRPTLNFFVMEKIIYALLQFLNVLIFA